MVLPSLTDSGLDDLLNNIARDLYEHKINEGFIHPELYKLNADKLMTALTEGLGGSSFDYSDNRNQLGAFLQQNIHAFSAAKSLYEMRHFANMMVREDDTLRSFTEFRNKVLSHGKQFNVNYLQAEYNTAVASAQMASQWDMLSASQYLEYTTAGDGRVRPEHAALDRFTAPSDDKVWNTIYPPNAWNCRCHVVPGTQANVGRVKVEKPDDWSKEPYKIDPYFQRNCGQMKAIFDIEHPNEGAYFIMNVTKPNQLLAAKHYNMKPVEDLLTNKSANNFSSVEQANNWWKDISTNGILDLKDPKGLTIRIDDETIRHTIEDHPKENRWKFINEIVNVITDADEIWSTRIKGNIERIYIKYYDQTPLIVRVNDSMRPYSIHNMLEDKKINKGQAISLRKGALIHEKK